MTWQVFNSPSDEINISLCLCVLIFQAGGLEAGE